MHEAQSIERHGCLFILLTPPTYALAHALDDGFERGLILAMLLIVGLNNIMCFLHLNIEFLMVGSLKISVKILI